MTKVMDVLENMSPLASQYQKQITGLARDKAYVVNGVKFDGYFNAVLLEAKGIGYAKLIRELGPKDLRDLAAKTLKQAKDQLKAANGVPIQWHFAEKEVADRVRELFAYHGINIEVIHTPMVFP